MKSPEEEHRPGGPKQEAYRVLQAPAEEGGVVYRAPAEVFQALESLERDFSPFAEGHLFFEDFGRGRLTPFAVRLFRKGYISVRAQDIGAKVQTITAIHPEIEDRLRKIVQSEAADEPAEDEVVIAESDLPFAGPLEAMPVGMHGTGRRRYLFGLRSAENPVEVLENILYGRTGKDDPESSHHGEHEISDGVDRG